MGNVEEKVITPNTERHSTVHDRQRSRIQEHTSTTERHAMFVTKYPSRNEGITIEEQDIDTSDEEATLKRGHAMFVTKYPSRNVGITIEEQDIDTSDEEATLKRETSQESTRLGKKVSQESLTVTLTDAPNRKTVDKMSIIHLVRSQEELLKNPTEESSKALRYLAANICSTIKANIKSANKFWNDDEKYIWMAYKENKAGPDGIQIYLMIEISGDSNFSKDDFPVEEIDVCVYKRDEISAKEELFKEMETAEELPICEMIMMRNWINKQADGLFANHKHLSIIEPSATRLRDSTYMVEREHCIALYVLKKGFIPIGETSFKNSIKEFPVDVREGIAYQAMQNEGTPTLKMGYKIARLENPQDSVTKFGTLGGFIDHPEYGTCGLTSAHVLLKDTEMYELMETGEITWLQIPSKIEVYFCDENGINVKIGHFVKAVYEKGRDGNYGFEVAIFQIGSSFKTAGEFRDVAHGADDVQHFFNIGKVFCPINCSQDSSFLKYGAVTGKTKGTFTQRLPVCTIRMVAFPSQPILDTITLSNQIVIKGSEGRPFSLCGDSGSLVMAAADNGETLCVGIVEGVTDDNSKTFVSPIGPVLEKFTVSSFKCFQQDELLEAVHTIEQNLEQTEGGLKQSLKETKEGLEQRLDHLEQTTDGLKQDLNQTKEDIEKRLEQTDESLKQSLGQTQEGLEQRLEQTKAGLEQSLQQTNAGLEQRLERLEQTTDQILRAVQNRPFALNCIIM